MSQKPQTKDERFMVALYEIAEKKGDVFSPVNRFLIGKVIGLNEGALQTICRTLLQTNFLRKSGDEDVYLTELGEQLVLGFIESK